jgi:hypothetical protein
MASCPLRALWSESLFFQGSQCSRISGALDRALTDKSFWTRIHTDFMTALKKGQSRENGYRMLCARKARTQHTPLSLAEKTFFQRSL